MWKRLLLASLLVLLTVLPAVAGERVLTGTVHWQGAVTLEKTVRVAKDATLVIAAGTVIRAANAAARITVAGRLQVNGSKDQPVVFDVPKGWQGIELVEPTGPSSFNYARFRGAETALSSIAGHFSVRNSSFADCGKAIELVRESDPLIEGCEFENNGTAVVNDMKSNATIRDNLFRGQTQAAIYASHNSSGRIEHNRFEKNAQGVALVQRFADQIVANTFSDNKLAIYCNQTQNTPRIAGNTFRNNKVALVNFSFAYPAVEENTFTGNGIAIRNDQFGSPLVSHNLFRANDTAIYNNRKSNPVVENNLIEKSKLAMFCDYSSYPEVKSNNFQGNEVALKIGIYQSADWEKRSGSKRLMQKESAARKSKNPLLAQAPTTFPDVIDLSGNWWGDDTARMAAAGPDANLDLFYDRHDKRTVTYEGFGPDSYILDLVRYSPWLAAPVAGAGPEAKK